MMGVLYWRHTTGIYCRPVCPVRPARSAMFRSSVGGRGGGGRLPPMPALPARNRSLSSAWIGSRAIVERALRLIAEEGALDQEGATVERLAQRLGVGQGS